VACRGEQLIGVLTYVIDGPDCEVLTLHADERGRDVGTALLEEVARIAAASGCRRVWLVTTNDNVDALRFHQRRGFHLAALRPGEVAASRRRLKPEIPASGSTGSRSATSSSSSGTCPARRRTRLERDGTRGAGH
jgi:ribosomal protein S18 acetylase RimI-like enzyme